MPKIKGKKRVHRKRAAMAEEERLLFVQRRALVEEEMVKQKQDIATKLINDKQQKEEQNCVINWRKLMEKWQAMFRKTQAQELRTDIDVLCQTSEKALDHRDNIIKKLVGELRESKQQLDQSLCYLQNVEQLLDQHKSRLTSLSQKFGTELDDLGTEFNSDRQPFAAQHQQDVCFTLDQLENGVDSKARLELRSDQQDIENKYIAQMSTQRVQLELEAELEQMWQQHQDTVRSYHKAIEDQRATCAILLARYELSSCQNDARTTEIQNIQKSCTTLWDRLSASMQQAEASARGLRVGMEEATDKSQDQKTQLGNICAQYRNNIFKLVMHSSAATKKLQGVIVKGERLACLVGVCRNLETEQERLEPFYCSPAVSEEQGLETAEQRDTTTPLLDQATCDYAALDGVWQRHRRVQLERLSRRRERAALTRENERLYALMCRDLDGLVVNGDTLRRRSDRPGVSCSTQCPLSSPEGALELQHTS